MVGQNLSLKLELQGGNSVAEVHANRAINWTTPNKTCDIAMGDLQSEEKRDILMEARLPPLPSSQQDLVIKASLSYFNVITSTLDTVNRDLSLQREGMMVTIIISIIKCLVGRIGHILPACMLWVCGQ